MNNQSININVDVRTNKAEKRMKALGDSIKRMQNAVRQSGDQANYFSRKIVQATDKIDRLVRGTNQVDANTKKAVNSANKLGKEFSKTNSIVGALVSKLKGLAATYLGVMGARALVNNTDTYISAQNKLNALPGGSPEMTEAAMDKMYAASQRARTGYADMMANVSKSMTLSGKSFDNNIDNAIKFQEIMGKTYALGGASANEQSQSMYQLIQSLGAGRLQGDELRSMLEGAPLAAAEIEKFAQEVYNTTESIKELGSQGKITSDLVVAAILNSEQKISEAFENTAMTYTQAWTMIKNTAFQSFRPVYEMLKNALNSEFGQAVINGIGIALQVVAKVLITVFNLIGKVYNFIVSNWGVIKNILIAIGTALTIYVVYNLALIAHQIGTVLLGLLISLGKYIAWVISLFVNLGITGALSLLTINWYLVAVIAVLAIVAAVIWWVSDSFRDACGIIVGSIFWVASIIQNVIAFIINLTMGLLNVIGAVCSNIGIYYQNAFAEASAAFWTWVQECLNGTSLIAKALSKIAELFGLDAVSIDTKISAARGKIQDYVDIGDAWNTGWSTINFSDPSDWYNKGYSYGTGAYDWVTNKLSNIIPGLPDVNGSAFALNTSDPSSLLGDDIGKNIGDTANNTGKMADAMDLAEEDLEYLRKIADMEWRKEFTTAEIKVDMSNYNTVNGDSDLDGIVTRLADKLYEELDMVANGVYA